MPKNGKKNAKKCKNAKSVEYQNWPMLIPHPSRTQKNAPKPQNKTIVGKEKSGWVKIHQKHRKMPFNQKDLGQIFLNQAFLNVLIKTFPKRYDTCRGLFFRPRIPSGAGCGNSRYTNWIVLKSRSPHCRKASSVKLGIPQQHVVTVVVVDVSMEELWKELTDFIKPIICLHIVIVAFISIGECIITGIAAFKCNFQSQYLFWVKLGSLCILNFLEATL